MLTIRWRFISFILSMFYQLGRSVTGINSFTAKSQQSQQLAKFPNFILWIVEEQIVPCESTSKEVSFEWLHIRISSTDSKVRATLPDAIFYSVLKGSTAYVCGVDLAITGLKIMFGQNGDLTGQKLHSPVMLTGHATFRDTTISCLPCEMTSEEHSIDGPQ